MQQLCAINECTKKLHTSIENVSPFVDDFTEKIFSLNVPIRLIASSHVFLKGTEKTC